MEAAAVSSGDGATVDVLIVASPVLVAALLLCGVGAIIAEGRRKRRLGMNTATAVAMCEATLTSSSSIPSSSGAEAHKKYIADDAPGGTLVDSSVAFTGSTAAQTTPVLSATPADTEESMAAEFASLRLSHAPGSSPGGRASSEPLLLGQGGFCRVYEARWGGELCAVKVPLDLSSKGAASLSAEARVLRQLRHPCICNFFGSCRLTLRNEDVPRLALVMEHMAGGTLHQLLAFPVDSFAGAAAGAAAADASIRISGSGGGGGGDDDAAVPSGTNGPPSSPPQPLTPLPQPQLPSLSLRLRLAGNVADALAFLHAKGLVHRDVKGSNVLLDATRTRAKLADFGLSKILSDARNGDVSSSNRCGTLRYMAPEAFRGEAIGTPVDVYAFALMLHEVTHGRKAFALLAPLQTAIEVTMNRARPPLTLQAAQGGSWLCPLLERCWSDDPLARPPMSEVVETLLAQVGSFYAQGPCPSAAAANAALAAASPSQSPMPRRSSPSSSSLSHHSAKAADAAFIPWGDELSASVTKHEAPHACRPPSRQEAAAAPMASAPPSSSTHGPQQPRAPQETGSMNSATPVPGRFSGS